MMHSFTGLVINCYPRPICLSLLVIAGEQSLALPEKLYVIKITNTNGEICLRIYNRFVKCEEVGRTCIQWFNELVGASENRHLAAYRSSKRTPHFVVCTATSLTDTAAHEG